MDRRTTRGESGMSLLMAIIVGLLLSSMGYVTVHMVVGDSRLSANQIANSQAFWLAEGALEVAFRWLRFENPPPGGTIPFTQFDRVSAGAGHYTVIIDPDDDNVSTYLKAYKITAIGEVAGVQRTLSVNVGMTTFSCYAYLSRNEGNGTIWWTTNDVVEGPLHSNDRLAIRESPIFMGKVTSSASSIREGNSYAPDFQRGYQLGVPPVAFPTVQDLINNYYASNNGQDPQFIIDARFNKDAEVIFNSDGTITYSVWHYHGNDKIWDVTPTTLPLGGLNGLIYVKGDVRVRGRVSGRVTLIATKEIYITDDILYADSQSNGVLAENTNNALGLISLDDIVVTNSVENQTDCRINAAMLALGDEFTVENYASGNPRGQLTIWGSLSELMRGPVGTAGNSSTITGYNKDYHYDKRFLRAPPPYFPVTGQYTLYKWNDENA